MASYDNDKLLNRLKEIADALKGAGVGPTGPAGPQGPQGEAGQTGTSVLTGSGVPIASLGNDGDVYFDLDSDPTKLYVKSGGFWDAGTVIANPVYSKTIVVEAPGSAEDVTIWRTEHNIEILSMHAVLIGSSVPSVTWTVRKNLNRNAVGQEVVTGGTTTTTTTTGHDVTALDAPLANEGQFIWFETTAQSGTVLEISVTILYQHT